MENTGFGSRLSVIFFFFSQITRLLWGRKVNFVVYNGPPLDPFQSCAIN